MNLVKGRQLRFSHGISKIAFLAIKSAAIHLNQNLYDFLPSGIHNLNFM